MLSPKTGLLAVRCAAIFTWLALIAAIFGISNNFYVLRFAIMAGLLVLATLSFLLGYNRFGIAGIALGLLFNPFLSIHLPHYIWTVIDVLTFAGVAYLTFWETNPYKKGTRFEQHVCTLFPDSDYFILDRTRDISKFSNRKVESDMHPDIVFKNKKTGRSFAVECKWRGQWAKGKLGDIGLWWKLWQGGRYAEYEKSFGIPVYVAFGISGTPERPKEVYFLELSRLQYTFLKQSFVRSGKSASQIG